MSSSERIRGLYGIADAGIRPELPMEKKVEAFLQGGASVIQVRMKSAPARDLFAATCRARERVAGRALLIVNDRPDVALASGADGVHVGEEDLPVEVVRRIVGPHLLVGATVRTLEQALEARRLGADYVGFGPVFETTTKAVPSTVRGLAALEHVAGAAGLPVVAIAGITLERVPLVARAGAAAFAVVSEVLGADRMEERARALSDAFAAATSCLPRQSVR